MACNWLMIRSFHCPVLVRIESNADFLSRFQSVVIENNQNPVRGPGRSLAMHVYSILTLRQLTHPRVLMGTVVLHDS